VSSFKPSKGASEVEASEEISSGLFVTGCNASELFETIEETLEKIAHGVESEVASRRPF
jgi:hypothetical protein